MKKAIPFLIMSLLVILSSLSLYGYDDSPLVGVWKPITYERDDSGLFPAKGLFIFTEKHFLSTIIWNLTKEVADSNFNCGNYEIQGNKIIFKQWMTIHNRPGNSAKQISISQFPSTSYSVKEATCKFEGNRLIITFRPHDEFILERIQE